MRSIVVLGSTGSIGTQALDVVRAQPARFRVVGLAACSSASALVEQAREFRPRWIAVSDPEAAERVRTELGPTQELFAGADALDELCRVADYELAVHGVVGAKGASASWQVLARGKQLALANKESLVIAGRELVELARSTGGEILPVDSELCAIHQCLRGESLARVRRVHLTASGGPFRDLAPHALAEVTPEMALRHPNWSMGPRITIGSATLMNKALEVLEVHHLLGLDRARIQVVIHRQSVVHSMVEFVDGSLIAQLGPPDMRGPLHYCLNHPDRAPAGLQGFDWKLFRSLTFEEVAPELFPSLELGFRALEQGGDSGAVLNAADEVGCQAFLERRIAFTDIYSVNARVLAQRTGHSGSLERLLQADALARRAAERAVEELAQARARN